MHTLSQGKLLENHTLHRSTSYMAHIWQYPLPPHNPGTRIQGL